MDYMSNSATHETGSASRKSCHRCGYEWVSVIDSPSRCPHCSSFRWNEAVVGLSCFKCGHEWATKGSGLPARCPKCRSSKWAEEPSAEVKGERETVIPAEPRHSIEIDRYTRMTVSQIFDEARCNDVAVLSILSEIRRQNAWIVQ